MPQFRAGELSAVNPCRAVKEARRAWLRANSMAESAGR
jgi:hypothetical protein